MKNIGNILIWMAIVSQQLAYLPLYDGCFYHFNALTHVILFVALIAYMKYGGTNYTPFILVGAAALPLNQLIDEMLLDPTKFQWNELLAYGWLALCNVYYEITRR